jgi:branched-chain amino acid transport system permease protein
MSLGLDFWLALMLGLAAAAAAGVVLGLTTLKLGGHYLAMVTISFQQMVTLVLVNWVEVTRGPDGISGIPRPSLPGLSFRDGGTYLALCLAILYLVGFLVWKLKRIRLGRAMQSIRDNELAAEVVGVDTYRTKVTAFALSAALGGLGGGLFAGGFSYISPDQFSFAESIVFLTMALLGGSQSPFGAGLGTALLILLPEWLRFLKVIYLAVYGLAVILIMIFMPEGIWGFVSGFTQRFKWQLPLSGPLPAPLAISNDLPGTPLRVDGIARHFGGLKAVDGVDMAIAGGSVHALIGPNGSGKTTFINVLSGIYKPTAGRVVLGEQDVTGIAPHDLASRGIGRTFQNIRLFRSMSVRDNVRVGAQRRGNPIGTGGEGLERRVIEALGFVGLADRADVPVTSLSYGHQRLVEIARALAGNPVLLLLDEPAAGLNLTEKQELVGLLKRLRGHGLTILLIDHDMNLVEQIADRITVLNFGKRIADGTPQEVLRHPDVIAAYLGEPQGGEYAAA